MSFNFPSERKPTPPNTPPGSPRTPDEKSVSEKTPRAKQAQLKKHQATRSLDIKNVKAQREKAWTPGTVEKSSGTGIPVLIDGFVNWLKKEEGGPQLGVKLFQELEKKLKTNKPIIAKINNFTSEEIETALGNMQQIPLMELGAALPLYHRCIGWLDSRQEALETPKHELPKLSSGGLSEPSREPSIETKVTTPRVSEKREAIEASIKASEATKKPSPDEKARQKSEPEVVSAFTTALVSAARKGDANQIDDAVTSLETYFYDRVALGGNPLEVTVQLKQMLAVELNRQSVSAKTLANMTGNVVARDILRDLVKDEAKQAKQAKTTFKLSNLATSLGLPNSPRAKSPRFPKLLKVSSPRFGEGTPKSKKASQPPEPTPGGVWINKQLEAAIAAIPPDRLAAHLDQAGKFITAILDDDAEASNLADDLMSSVFTADSTLLDGFLRLEALFTLCLEKTEKEDLVRLELKLPDSGRSHSHEALQNVVKRAVDKLPKPERKEIERKIRTEMTPKDPEEKGRDDKDLI